MLLRRFLCGLVPLVALVAGCSEAGNMDGAVAVAPPVAARAAGGTASTATSVAEVASYRTPKNKPENLWAKAWIGPNGGSVEYYGFRLVVPAGAVDRVTMFTISLPKEGTERALAEFGPHNVAFAQPITIELPYVGTTAEGATPGALWYNEQAGAWQSVGGALTADGQRVQAQVKHFSEYGTQDAARGGTLLSGN